MKLSAWFRRLPWSIVAIAVLLILFGWLGIARCETFSGGSGSFLRRQIIFSIVTVAAMLAVSAPNYQVLCRYSYIIFLLFLLFCTF